MCSLKILAIVLLCYYVQPRRLDSFDFQRLRYENPRSPKRVSEQKDDPPQSSNPNDPILKGFSVDVHGKELFDEFYSHMQIVTRLINYFFLSQNLLLGTIAPELTRQFLQTNINFTAIQGFHSQPSIGGFWQQHNFVKFMKNLKNHTTSFTDVDKEKIRRDLRTIEKLKGTHQTKFREALESIDVDEYFDTLPTQTTSTQTTPTQTTGTSTVKDSTAIQDLFAWLSELDKLLKDVPRNTENISTWFKEHTDTTKLEAAIKYATDFLKNTETSKFANRHPDLAGLIAHGLDVVSDVSKNQTQLRQSLSSNSAEFTKLIQEQKDLEKMKRNDASRHLLELLIWIRNGSEFETYENRSLLFGLGEKGIRQAFRDFQDDWLVDFLGDSSAVQLYFLFEPVEEFLRYMPEVDYRVKELNNTVTEYGKVWHPFIDYLENMERLKRRWTTLKLREKVDSITKCAEDIQNNVGKLDMSTHYEKFNKVWPQLIELDKAIGSCSTLKRLTDPNLLDRFKNPNLANIMETVNGTIRFIDLEQLKNLEKQIEGKKACIYNKLIGSTEDLKEVIDKLKTVELIPSSCSFVSSSMADSLFNISDSVWKTSEELEGLWAAVDTVQSFLDSGAVFGELCRMKDVLRDNRLYAEYETLLPILNHTKFTMREVEVMAEGVEMFKELSGAFKLKRHVDSWDRNMKKLFENMRSENQRNLLKVEWTAFQTTFNESFSQLTLLADTLHTSSDPDPYPILEASSRLQLTSIELKNILDHLIQLRKGSSEHLHWRDQEDLEKWIGEMREVIGFGERFRASHKQIQDVLPVMKRVSGWLKFVMNRERKLLREEDEDMCDCDMKYRKRDICFRMCEFASLNYQKDQEDENVEVKKEVLPSWMQFEVKVYHFYLPLIALLIALAFYDYLFRVDLTHY